MASKKSFLAGVMNVWQSPEQAIYEDNLVSDGFVQSDISDSNFSTDTLNADVISNLHEGFSVSDSAANSKIYGNGAYIPDGYEDLTESKFVVAKSASFDDEQEVRPNVEFTARESALTQPVYTAKPQGFSSIVDTSFLFAEKRDEAPKAEAKASGHPMSFTKVVPLADVITSFEPIKTTGTNRAAEAAVSIKADNQVKASVGFNTSAAASATQATFSSARFTTGGRAMTSDKVSVQILRPTKVEDVSDACALVKEGNIVMANLCGISDINSRLRYLDYLSGCCKGCDADFREVVKVESADCVLVATPRGVGIKSPVVQEAVTEVPEAQPAQTYEKTGRPSAFSNVFGNVDLGGGKGATTNWYTDRF